MSLKELDLVPPELDYSHFYGEHCPCKPVRTTQEGRVLWLHQQQAEAQAMLERSGPDAVQWGDDETRPNRQAGGTRESRI